MIFVLDGSLTTSWGFLDEQTSERQSVLELLRLGGAEVPAIWPTEVANSMLTGIKKDRITPVGAEIFLRSITALNVLVHPPTPSLEALLVSATQFGLTVYDATYVELALRRQLPLATIDKAMRRAAMEAGVDLVL